MHSPYQFPNVFFWFFCFALCSAFSWRWMISPHCITASVLDTFCSFRFSFLPVKSFEKITSPIVSSFLSPFYAMGRRVYLLWYVCPRGPFPPAPLQHASYPPFPFCSLAVLALPAPRPSCGLPGWSVGREPSHSKVAVKAAMARVVGCRAVHEPGILGMVVHSHLASPFHDPTGPVWLASWRFSLGPDCGCFCWAKELPARPVFIIFGEMSNALPCGWRGAALLIGNKRFISLLALLFPFCLTAWTAWGNLRLGEFLFLSWILKEVR